jgi:hypothetical protein
MMPYNRLLSLRKCFPFIFYVYKALLFTSATHFLLPAFAGNFLSSTLTSISSKTVFASLQFFLSRSKMLLIKVERRRWAQLHEGM